MLKQELVVAIQAELAEEGIKASQKAVQAHLNAFESVVTGVLQEGGEVKIKGFVDFTTSEVAERTARNPQTGEEVTVPAHTKAKASLSKTLRKI